MRVLCIQTSQLAEEPRDALCQLKYSQPPHNGYGAIRLSGRPVLKDAILRLHQGNPKVANHVPCFMNQRHKSEIVMLTANLRSMQSIQTDARQVSRIRREHDTKYSPGPDSQKKSYDKLRKNLG